MTKRFGAVLVVMLFIGCSHVKKPEVTQTGMLDAPLSAASEPLSENGEPAVPSPDETVNGESEESIFDEALELTDAAQQYWAEGDSEKAITALDQAYAAILKVDSAENEKITQQKEDLRFMISKRILEIYASRHRAVQGISTPIPMTMNSHVEREIRLFQGAERDFFIESFQRSGRYHDDIVRALREAGLPEDLAWLPLIESGYKVRALSRARALGLWQFIPSTGYKFGLKRNDWVDERLDPKKSTEAAIAYLKELHQIFGDWTTVLAAYNCGEGNVLRVIRDQKINYLDNFWDLYERLPRETARYVPRFLAALSIIKDPDKYGFTLDGRETPAPSETVMIERPVHLRSISEAVGISVADLALLNPELRREATPPAPYALKVPPGSAGVVQAKIDSMAKYVPPRPEYVVHRVRRGETLSGIALRYRTSVQRIVEANRMGGRGMIRAGQRLRIPVRSAT